MGRALSRDLRDRVVAGVDGGLSCRAAAERFGVSAASAIRWRQLAVQHGTPAAKPQGGDRRSAKIEDHAALIYSAVERQFDITLEELRTMLAGHGVSARSRHCGGFCASPDHAQKDGPCERTGPARHRRAALGLVRGPAQPQSRAPGVHRRDLGIDQHGPSPWTLPSWRAVACWRAAWALEDDNLRRRAPHRHGGADGARRADQSRRVPRLCRPGARPRAEPGDVVIMDNLSSHKAPAVREMIEAADASLLYLPPYSPDFNPIEQAFSKLKAICAKPPSAPATACGTPSVASSTSTRLPSAPTTSPTQDTMQTDRKPL